MPEPTTTSCRVAVIWIDWYAYHVARFRGLLSAPSLADCSVGFELVGGIGVHAGLKFREELPADLPVETLMPGTSWREANKAKLAWILWTRLSQLKPEVLLVPGYYTLPAIVAAIWARTHGAASVLMTESTASDHQRSWWKEKLKSLGMRLLFSWAVTGGEAHVAYLHQLEFPRERIAGCYDVVDNDMFRAGTAAIRCGDTRDPAIPEQEYFLYVGRLAAEKNVAGLLRSWFAYRERGGLWPLVLVGDGPQAGALQAAANASGFAHDVYFPGLRSSRELLPYYAFAGCFVLPSTREPWGLVVNEAMAAGLPVLVSEACGCGPELVKPGHNGFSFNPKNVERLTQLLYEMDSMPADERRRMGAASVRIIGNYSPERFGRSIAAISHSARHRGELQPIVGSTR